MNKYMKKIDKKSKEKSHNRIKGRETILTQKIKELMERLIGYGFIREIEPEVYQGTELMEKYNEEGATFSLDDDEDMMNFLMDNHELFLKVVGDEFFGKMKIHDEKFKDYVINYIRKNSKISLYGLSDKALTHFYKESDLTKDELRDLTAEPFFKDVFIRRISKVSETLTEFGLLVKSN